MLHIDEMFNYVGVSEMIFNAKEEAKYSHLLEGFTYAEAIELWFAARN